MCYCTSESERKLYGNKVDLEGGIVSVDIARVNTARVNTVIIKLEFKAASVKSKCCFS